MSFMANFIINIPDRPYFLNILSKLTYTAKYKHLKESHCFFLILFLNQNCNYSDAGITSWYDAESYLNLHFKGAAQIKPMLPNAPENHRYHKSVSVDRSVSNSVSAVQITHSVTEKYRKMSDQKKLIQAKQKNLKNAKSEYDQTNQQINRLQQQLRAIQMQITEIQFKIQDISDNPTIKESTTRQREFLTELQQQKDRLKKYIKQLEREIYLIKQSAQVRNPLFLQKLQKQKEKIILMQESEQNQKKFDKLSQQLQYINQKIVNFRDKKQRLKELEEIHFQKVSELQKLKSKISEQKQIIEKRQMQVENQIKDNLENKMRDLKRNQQDLTDEITYKKKECLSKKEENLRNAIKELNLSKMGPYSYKHIRRFFWQKDDLFFKIAIKAKRAQQVGIMPSQNLNLHFKGAAQIKPTLPNVPNVPENHRYHKSVSVDRSLSNSVPKVQITHSVTEKYRKMSDQKKLIQAKQKNLKNAESEYDQTSQQITLLQKQLRAIKKEISEIEYKIYNIPYGSVIQNSTIRQQRELLTELQQQKDKLKKYTKQLEWEIYQIKQQRCIKDPLFLQKLQQKRSCLEEAIKIEKGKNHDCQDLYKQDKSIVREIIEVKNKKQRLEDLEEIHLQKVPELQKLTSKIPELKQRIEKRQIQLEQQIKADFEIEMKDLKEKQQKLMNKLAYLKKKLQSKKENLRNAIKELNLSKVEPYSYKHIRRFFWKKDDHDLFL